MTSTDLPVGVVVDREERTLRVEWDGADATVIPWELLRLSCPCAQCQGEFRTETIDQHSIAQSESETDMVDITMMGHYALQPEWRSGHTTGIYTWEYLQKITPRTGR